MNNRPWYKRYPADFISGVLELTLEQKGAYSIIIDLMYDRGGALPDNDKYIAGVCGCSIRKWRSIRIVLEKANKIFSKEGIFIIIALKKR
ncbi:YdaU family protein [Candidatus Liberibacter solanacearum]|uniref:YdaU family protein n=1 Tax=Candidatus Liberibacter solanacearum TaxID=556287 RepID=UPI001FE084F2|nr:YdaU family protein [Candidatus Liberibacter solanacearum]